MTHGFTRVRVERSSQVFHFEFFAVSIFASHLLFVFFVLHTEIVNKNITMLTFFYPPVTERSLPANDKKMELHCYLSTDKGADPCFNRKELHINWSSEDDTPINGSRFVIEHPHNCFSKLIIDTKSTDHHRKWRCHLTQNDLVKATISYTTTVKGATQPVHKMKDVAQYVQSVTSSPFSPDGLEEVFATVGESVLLNCGNTSSPDMKWTLREKQLRDASSPDNGQIKASHVNQDSSLVISRLSSLHAGDYQCSHSTDKNDVLNKFRLHTLDGKY